MGRPKETIVQKFFKHFVKEERGCWEWTSKKTDYGHGVLTHNKKGIKAHRISWEIFRGAIPKGKLVCHTCDNPSCVNPEHLYLGTQVENMRDAALRGRMRKLRENGMFYHQIAEKFGVKTMAIFKIIKQKHWRHVQ